jgi:HPt (histidine-containing phosphotransfer) domain-containing protein
MHHVNSTYIDLKLLKEQTFNETPILIMIIEQFLEDIDEYIDVLKSELPNQHWELLFQATHKIKPNISLFGIKDLEPIILQIEKKFKEVTDLEDVSMMADSVMSVLKQAKIELQTKLIVMHDE